MSRLRDWEKVPGIQPGETIDDFLKRRDRDVLALKAQRKLNRMSSKRAPMRMRQKLARIEKQRTKIHKLRMALDTKHAKAKRTADAIQKKIDDLTEQFNRLVYEGTQLGREIEAYK